MMGDVMTIVTLALGASAVAALIVIIAIAATTSAGRRPPPKPVRTPGVARARGAAARPKPDTAGLHLLDLD